MDRRCKTEGEFAHDQIRQLRFQEMRRRIQEGWDSLRHGEGVDGEEFMAQLEAELPAPAVRTPAG